MRQNKRQTGARYEEMASKYLEEKGYRVLERNFRCHDGEIDLIVESPQNVLVFVEIKYRASDSYGDALEAVDARKQKRISRTALYYYACHGYGEWTPCRFDVVAVYGDERVVHIEDAFEYRA